MPSLRSARRIGLRSLGTSEGHATVSLDDADLALRFWKPFDVLTAFTDQDGRATLADYVDISGVYAAGRLDRDSEGLLILTKGKHLRTQLMDPTIGHPRTYLVQVEGVPTADACGTLERGVDLKDGRTRPAAVELLSAPPDVPARSKPIRVRKSIPDSWMRLTLTEGKNRQVRRMTAAVGFPTLRLIREAIGPISLVGLTEGEWKPLSPEERHALDRSLSSARDASRPARGRPQSRRRSRD